MKKIYFMALMACFASLPLMTSCMGDEDDPNTDGFIVTSPVSIGEVNSSIGAVKEKYCAQSNTAEIVSNSSNFFSKINEDLIIEGVVVANDAGGNLYQTLMLRQIDQVDGQVVDQSIILAIKNTFLSPYFSLGQRLKVNLKGLYAGVYSKVPKIGQPYRTSSGNFRLGPMLLELCSTNIELVGKPNLQAPELQPVDLTQTGVGSLKKNYKTVPMLATVEGTIDEVQGSAKNEAATGELSGKKEPLPKIFAPEVLYDAGYAVDRNLTLSDNKGKMTLRTSTQNPIAFMVIPEDKRSYTGMLSYYSDWQIQLRSIDDIQTVK